MIKLQKLAGTVLLTSLAFGMVAPQALAASNTLDGKGTVTFEADTTITGPVDPEEPGKEVTVDPEEGTTQTEQGTLSVDFVSAFKFGKNKINSTTEAGEYFATPTKVKKGEDLVDRGNYVQVTDKRAGSAKQGWNLSAKMTQKFTSATKGDEIAKSTISLSNPFLNTTQADKADVVANSTVTIESDATSSPVASAPAGKGWGTYTVEYGTTEDEKMAESVKLSIPASTPLEENDEYTAAITWTIANLD